MKANLLSTWPLPALLAFGCAQPVQAALVIESLHGPVTPTEIAAFKAHMKSQAPPPTPWLGPGHNAWSFG